MKIRLTQRRKKKIGKNITNLTALSKMQKSRLSLILGEEIFNLVSNPKLISV